MSVPAGTSSQEIINSYLSGAIQFDQAVEEYGKATGLGAENVNKRVNAFTQALLSSNALQSAHFSKLVELEHRIHQSSPASAYKVYEKSVQILLGGNSKKIDEVIDLAQTYGLRGRSSFFDRICLQIRESMNEYFVTHEESYFEKLLSQLSALVNGEIRKEKEVIDPMINKQHLVLQYLSLVSEEERNKPEIFRFCFELTKLPDAKFFLAELEKVPAGFKLLGTNDPTKLSNFLISAKMLYGAKDPSEKNAILLAAKILPGNSDERTILQAAAHLHSLGERTVILLFEIHNFTNSTFTLDKVLQLEVLPEDTSDPVSNKKESSESSKDEQNSPGTTLSSILYSPFSLLRNVGSAIGSALGGLFPSKDTTNEPLNENLTTHQQKKEGQLDTTLPSSTSSPLNTNITPISRTPIEEAGVQALNQQVQNYFNSIDAELGAFIGELPPLPEGSTVSVSPDGNTLTIQLPKTVTAKVKQEATLSEEECRRLNRQDIRFYEPIRDRKDMGEGKQVVANEQGQYPVQGLSYFGSIGGMVTRALIGGRELTIGPTVTFTKGMKGSHPTLAIQGVPNLSFVELCNSPGDEYTQSAIGNGKLYMKFASIIPFARPERWFLKDLHTLMTILRPA